MRITLEQEGGIGGLRMRPVVVDTDTLPEDETAAWRQLIERTRFFSQPAARRGHGADLQRYTITVEDGERRRTVSFDDASLPEELVPLLNQLIDARFSGR